MEPDSFPHAAACGDMALVKKLINAGKNVNARDSDGSTSLHLAINSGKSSDVVSEIVILLLKAGAQVNARNNKGYTPLHVATMNGDSESVYQLLEAGADADASIDVEGVTSLRLVFTSIPTPEVGEILCMLMQAGASEERGRVRGPNRISPLRKAILSGKIHKVKELVRAGADVNAINWHGRTSLHTAVETQRDDDLMCRIIKILLEAGASPNISDFDKRATPLHAATIFGKVKRVELLLKAGADLEAMNIKCSTSLHLAISSDKSDDENFNLIQLLVQAGASLTQRSGQGYDALQTAVGVGKVKVVEYLIKAGGNVHAIGNFRATSLHVAIRSDIPGEDRTKIIQMLLESGISLEAVKNFKGLNSYLHDAVCSGRVEAVELLTKAGANVHETFGKASESFLHSVIRSWSGKNDDDRLNIISLLLAAGVSVDALDKDQRTPLHCAVISGNLRLVEQLIQAGANVNAADTSGKTSFHIATSSKMSDEDRSKIISLLVNADASLDTRDSNGQSPFDYAVIHGHVLAVEQLIKAGANVHSADAQGNTCLHMVANVKDDRPADYSRIVDLLLEAGASLEKRNIHGRTPLHVAALLGHPKGVERFIRAGADVNAVGHLGQTSLHIAMKSENKTDSDSSEITRLLLEAGALVNCSDNRGYTPLHVAVVMSKLQTVKRLIDAHANVHAAESKGATSLHLISSAKYLTHDLAPGHVKIVQSLLMAGASLDSRDNKNFFSPLHYAVAIGNVLHAEVLIKIGADVNAVSKNLETSLHLALCLSRKNDSSHQMIQLLLKSGASLYVRDKDGRTPLIYAVSFGDAKLVEQMIAAGADPKAITDKKQSSLHFANSKEVSNESSRIISILLKANVPLEGRDEVNRHTPLHYAVIAGDVAAVERLIRAGSDVNAVDHNGMSNLHLIFRPNNALDDRTHGIVRLLLKAGAKLDMRDKDGKTPLVLAVTFGNAKFIQQLIRGGADASIFAKNLSILHYAVRSPMFVNECLDVIPLLVKAGAPLESCDKNGQTPLCFAAAHGCTKLVEQFIEAGADVNATDFRDRTVLHHVLDDGLSPNVSVESKRKMIRLLMGSGAEKQSASVLTPSIRWNRDIQTFYQECKDELCLMQTSIVIGSVTFYQILVKKNVSSYMRNDYIVGKFKKENFIGQFPIFGKDLEKSFFATQAQRNLMDQASRGLYHILRLYNTLVYDKILLNLDNGDLRNLRDVMMAPSAVDIVKGNPWNLIS